MAALHIGVPRQLHVLFLLFPLTFSTDLEPKCTASPRYGVQSASLLQVSSNLTTDKTKRYAAESMEFVESQQQRQRQSHTEQQRQQQFQKAPVKASQLRPNAGGKPDQILIGMMCKAFYGLDLKAGTSTLDLVTYMNWNDPRVASVVPDEADSITLSHQDAQQMIWLPDLAITNRDLSGMEPLSSGTTIAKTGDVTKIDRLMVTVRSKFDVRAFPFDTQDVTVLAASATLMSDNLVFNVVNDRTSWGVDSAVFAGKDQQLTNVSMNAFTEKTGALEKSRAVFTMTVKRVSSAYMPLLVLPEVVLVFLACSAFWLPLLVPFAMPRVATSIITLLAVLAHRQASILMLPSGGALCWIDVFEESVLMLVFSCSVFNVLVEGINHQQKVPDLAEKMNSELKRFLPLLSTFVIVLCFCIRDADYVTTLAFIMRTTLVVCLGTYGAVCVRRSSRISEEPAST